MACHFMGHPAFRNIIFRNNSSEFFSQNLIRTLNHSCGGTSTTTLFSSKTDAGTESSPPNSSNFEGNVDKTELEKHQQLVNEWWDPRGHMKGLHAMNDLRVKFIANGFINAGQLKEDETQVNSKYLQGLKICDVGCGGGILSEVLARLGADVTGIEPGDDLVKLATAHAEASTLPNKPKYICSSIEEHAKSAENTYDGLVASEVVEHVPNKKEFLEACLQTIKPGGSLFITTPNRTFASWLGSVVIAENVLNIVPKGIHNWNLFITPSELKAILEKLGCRNVLMNGAMYDFITNRWFFSTSQFHYVLHAVKVDRSIE
ncbi:ubiquinone biosynthesis O-methyltransferase, mitochondrial [Nilaparvata lugens]|uniref:ubiquinone biosynthesis O-methyltransferase, mitochondrial n=1 Tax=Nilaparvata lugens TaxID=108931 RepID=UPI00193D9111|nr:ubiquinone biosynthesis O-methyltransferase, mitochondrial [Nilaparvata lugens]